MRVLLVNPPKSKGKFCLREECCSGVNPHALLPAQLAQVGGILRHAGHAVSITDFNVEENGKLRLTNASCSWSYNYDVVVSWAMMANLGGDLEVLRLAKKSGLPTISIVNDPYYPEQIIGRYPFIDYFVREEREYVVPKLIEALSTKDSVEKIEGLVMRKKDKIVSTAMQCPVEVDMWPMPLYEQLPLEKYDEAILLAGKGCNYNCGFCFYANTEHRYKNVGALIKEIRLLSKYDYSKFFVYDLNFTTSKDYVRAFCKQLIKKRIKIKWVCDGRVNEVDKELLELMKKAGCIRIVYGIESGSDRILKKIRKGFRAEHAMQKIALTAEAGIEPYPCFIIGYPWETREDLEQTERFIKETVPKYTDAFGLSFLNPAPGSQIYDYLVSKGLAKELSLDSFVKFGAGIESWGSKPFAATEHLSTQQLVKAHKRILRRALLHRVVSGQAISEFVAMPFTKKISTASQIARNFTK